MSKGVDHIRAGTTLAGLSMPFSPVVGLGVLFSNFLCSPDMDLKQSHPQKNWGLFQLYWLPYAKLFKHRGISHFPILGTLSRVFWVLPLVVGFFVLTDTPPPSPTSIGMFILGMALNDILHLLMDSTNT